MTGRVNTVLYNEINQAYEENKKKKYTQEEYEALKEEIILNLKEYGVYEKNNINSSSYPLYENISGFFRKEGFCTSLTAIRTIGHRGAKLEISL